MVPVPPEVVPFAVYAIVAVPVPVVALVMRSHVALLEAVQLQSAPVVRVNEPEPPVVGSEADVGDSVYVHADDCVIVTV
jgi:hypothetical protein